MFIISVGVTSAVLTLIDTFTLLSLSLPVPDDVRGDAHHQRGRGGKQWRRPWLRLSSPFGFRGTFRVSDGVHAGGEGPAPGHVEGDAGELGTNAGQAAGGQPRTRRPAEAAQLCLASGKISSN